MAIRAPFRLAAGFVLAAPLLAQAAIDIRFDYTYDGGFFSGANVSRRDALELAAQHIEARLVDEHFAALTPGGLNTWTLGFENPGAAGFVELDNLSLAADTLTIHVGGMALGAGGPLGEANYSFSASGFSSWFATLGARNSSTNYEPLGGGITFNASANWYFGTDAAGIGFSQYDFYSVATHEIFHMLGFGMSDAFAARVDGPFYGSSATQVYGGPVPMFGDGHWDQSITVDGEVPNMVPALVNGVRRGATELDYAALRDIGYNVTTPVPEPATWLMGLAGLAVLGGWRRRAA